MKNIRSCVSSASPSLGGDPGPFAFNQNFLDYELYATIEGEAYRNIGLAFAAIFLVTICMIPHPVVALLVFFSVAATIVEVLGYMYFWGMHIDSVTVIMLIIGLGLAIDYSAHIGVAFLHSTALTRQDAAIQALGDVGAPVLHGAISTFIAVCALSGSSSYVFVSFFRQLFLATIFGCGHGLLLLPVLLSMVGPQRYQNAHSPTVHTDADELDTKPVKKVPSQPEIGAPQPAVEMQLQPGAATVQQ